MDPITNTIIYGGTSENRLKYAKELVNTPSPSDEQTYQSNKKIFEITDATHIFEQIKDFLETRDIISGSYNIIVINDISNIDKSSQYLLRAIFERNINTCRFIILTDSLYSIIEPLQSRCLCLFNKFSGYTPRENAFRDWLSQKPMLKLSIINKFLNDLKE